MVGSSHLHFGVCSTHRNEDYNSTMAQRRIVASYVGRCLNCAFTTSCEVRVDPQFCDVNDPKLRDYRNTEAHLAMHNRRFPACGNPQFEYRDTLDDPPPAPPEGHYHRITWI